MKKWLAALFLVCGSAFAQWTDFSGQTAATNLSAAMNGKRNVQVSAGACNTLAGTAGKDVCWDSTNGVFYDATVTGSPATWVARSNFSNAKVWAALSATAPILFDSGTGAFSCATATGSVPGCLSAADWTSFNAKQAAIAGAPGTWPSTFAPINTGDWAGTWQTHAPSYFQTALGFTPANVASNLSDLASAATARTNLGLGGLAVLNNPMTSAGDFIVGGASGVLTRLAVPGNGTFCPNWSSGVLTWITCPGAGGGLSSVGLGLTSMAWLTVSNSPLTTNGTIGLAPTTGQTSHQVIGTCGTATTFGPCALVAGDVPTLNQDTTGTAGNVTGIVAEANGGTGAANTPGAAGHYLRSNGTHYLDSAIQAADVPTLNQSTTGNAATATALAATPTLCPTGQAPTGVTAAGNAAGCAVMGAAPITGTGDPNLGAVACLATASSPIATYTEGSNAWYCLWNGTSTTSWKQISASIGTGAYTVSGVTGTVHLDLAANRPTGPTDGYLFCASDTNEFSQYSTVDGWSGVKNASGHAVAVFTGTGLAYYLPGSCTPTSSGGATIPATTSALKGDGAGNAAAVTGTGTNCVHVDGTSAACPGGGATIPSISTPLKGDGTGNAAAATASDTSTLSYVTGGGTAQAQTATYAVAPTLTDGLRLCWKPAAANTAAAPTFAPNGLTGHAVVKTGGAALVANDLTTTAIACAIYDLAATQWELQNPQTSSGGTSYTFRDNLLNTSNTIDFDPDDVSTFQLRDDFSYGTLAAASITNGQMGWTVAAIGTSTAALSGQTTALPNIGVVRVATGSVAAGNGNSLSPSSTSTLLAFAWGLHSDISWKQRWIFRLNNNATVRYHVGMSSSTTAVPPIGFGIRYDTNASAKCGPDSTNFSFYSYNNGSGDACAASIPVDTNFHALTVRSDGTTANKIWLSVDGGAEISVCASGCTLTATVTSTALVFAQSITNDAGTSGSVSFDTDFFAFDARVATSKDHRN